MVRGGVPPADAQLIPVLPGALNFVLRWTGNADLNLAVLSPRAADGVDRPRTVYPIGGLDRVATGGRTPFDHRGGPAGGIEIVFWPGTFPAGAYQIGSVHISGATTPATVDAFVGAERVDIRGAEGAQPTVNFTAEPINPEFGAGQLVGSVRVFPAEGVSAASTATVKASKKKPAAAVPAAQPKPARKTR